MNKEDLLRLFEHESFNYNQEKLQRIKKIIFSMNIEGRPTCVNFKQFWEDLDEDKCPCTIERPSPENLFRGASFNPSMGERSIIWESAVKVCAFLQSSVQHLPHLNINVHAATPSKLA